MKLESLKKRYLFFISLGADEQASESELKKIKLFNFFCLVWYFLATALIIFETSPDSSYFNVANLTHVISMLFLGGIQFIHYRKKRVLAYSLFIVLLLTIVFVFSNFLIQGELLEYYYILIPPAALVFIDKKEIIWGVLIVSVLVFVVPNRIHEHYPDQNFNNIVQPFLLIVVFIVINFFKKLNIKNEKALKEKSEELERKNNSQSQFFRNISHEIRTPLTLIKGQAERIGSYENNKLNRAEVRSEINKQVDKIAKMVDEILDIEKMETSLFKLHKQEVNLSQVVSKVYHSFKPSFEQKEIGFYFKKPIRGYIVSADDHHIERTLNNIIKNALKYTPSQGSVSIEFKRKKQDIIINIKDSGIGIPQKDINNIWNKFYQVDNDINKTGGSGIGLSFCKKIIELHGGKIEVSSTPSEGSIFRITLPLRAVQTKKDTLQESKLEVEQLKITNESSLPIFNSARFLIVDDDWEIRALLKKYLDAFRCIESNNGLEALNAIKKNKIDMIIVDYMMPKMNGKEFIQSLRALNYNIPVIMLTARADKESRLEIFKLGIDDYLTKPFNKNELLIRVSNALTNYYNRMDYLKKENVNPEELKKNDSWIKKLEKFIEQECANPKLNLNDISYSFNVSVSTLSRKINSATGLKPKEFIKEVKLSKARKLLEINPEMSLKELSLHLGYRHSYNFSEIYFKRFGQKPWRNKN